MPPVGRPRALDDTKRREIYALVSAGCGIEGAARYVCCAPSTIRREALRNPDFHEQLRRAELTAQLSPLRAMQQAAATHWRAAAWLLERTLPLQFARRNADTLTLDRVSQLFDEILEIVTKEIPDPELGRHVKNRVTATLQHTLHEKWAACHHRRDPARAKRFYSTTTETELDQAYRDLEKAAQQLPDAPPFSFAENDSEQFENLSTAEDETRSPQANQPPPGWLDPETTQND